MQNNEPIRFVLSIKNSVSPTHLIPIDSKNRDHDLLPALYLCMTLRVLSDFHAQEDLDDSLVHRAEN